MIGGQCLLCFVLFGFCGEGSADSERAQHTEQRTQCVLCTAHTVYIIRAHSVQYTLRPHGTHCTSVKGRIITSTSPPPPRPRSTPFPMRRNYSEYDKKESFRRRCRSDAAGAEKRGEDSIISKCSATVFCYGVLL